MLALKAIEVDNNQVVNSKSSGLDSNFLSKVEDKKVKATKNWFD